MDGLALGLAAATAVALVIAAAGWQQAISAKATLSKTNNYDRLTGLPNRRQLTGWLDEMLKDSRRHSGRVAVLFIELNRFEYLNEAYGHEVGDALMIAASKAIKSNLKAGEILVRYGGPQFVVLNKKVTSQQVATDRAGAILDGLAKPFEISKDRIRLTANVGVLVSDQQYTGPDEAMLDASVALENAKEGGPGTIVLFDTTMQSTLNPSAAERRLKEALDKNEFWILYLPVVDLESNRLVGAEALLRWADPQQGIVSPAMFIRSLEETGLIVQVGQWVLREACNQAQDWATKHPDNLIDLTVNISPRQLMQSDFAERVIETVSSTGIDPHLVTLEITESALMRDVDGAWATLRELKTAGLKLSLDDFGTRYSSLSYLRKFQLDSLKIDRSFVSQMHESNEDRAIVSQLVGLSHALGMRAVAEGVEDLDQVNTLKNLTCDRAQGFHFSTPQPPDVIDSILARGILDSKNKPATVE